MKSMSLAASIGRRLTLLLLILWAIFTLTALCLLAGYIREQTTPYFSGVLETELSRFKGQKIPSDYSLPVIEYTPDMVFKYDYLWVGDWRGYICFEPSMSFPPLRKSKINAQGAWLTLNKDGLINAVKGFQFEESWIQRTGLTLQGGFLSIISMDNNSSPYLNLDGYNMALGSFPSNKNEARIFDEQGNVQKVVSRETPPMLLNGIESGEFHFDSSMLRRATVLRGRWLCDESGEPQTFVLAAYCWSPLNAAFRALVPFSIELLVFFVLLGLALWVSLRKSLINPLSKVITAVDESPMTVSTAEYDYQFRYNELQSMSAAYLLRRQMQQATVGSFPSIPFEDRPSIQHVFDIVYGKQLPLLLGRGFQLQKDYQADGIILAESTQVEDALLALVQASLSYANASENIIFRTRKKEAYLLAEVVIKPKPKLHQEDLASLWNGIFQESVSKEASLLKLRKIIASIHGVFITVRLEKQNLVFILGFPLLSDE
jgi:hypothetical protein